MELNSIIDALRQNLGDNIKRQLKRQQFNFCTKFKARFDRNVPPLVGVLYRDLERTFDASLGLIISRSLDEIHLTKTDNANPKPAANRTVPNPSSNSVKQNPTSGEAAESVDRSEDSPVTDEGEVGQLDEDGDNGNAGELQSQPLKDGNTRKRRLEAEPQSSQKSASEQSLVAINRTVGGMIKECIICPIDLCFVICNNKPELDEHLIHNHNLRPFCCALRGCNLYFLEKTNLLSHQLNAHKGITEWQCGECNKILPSHLQLNRHHTLEHYHRVYCCTVGTCKHNSSEYEDVLEHIKNRHKRQYEMVATAAGNRNDESGGNPKKAKHSKNPPPTATYPEDTSSSMNSMNSSSTTITTFECPFEGCADSYESESSLNEHIGIVHSTKSVRFGCAWPGCAVQSETEEVVLQHITDTHLPPSVRTRSSRGAFTSKVDTDPQHWLSIIDLS